MRIGVEVALVAVVSAFGGAASAQSGLPQCGGFPSGAQSYECDCPATRTGGSVWGSGPYTGDSDICEAARHAGAIGVGGGPVMVLQAAGMASYTGSARNGVTTRDWGSYGVSYSVVIPVRAASCDRFSASASPMECYCDGSEAAGSVWGMSPFTGDSDICTAARFEGVIGANGGMVRLIAVEGLSSYVGGDNNGVSTSDWGSYGESFVFDWNMQ